MKLEISKEWIERMAAKEGDLEIGAGSTDIRVRHVARGTEYTLVALAYLQTGQPLADMTPMIVYRDDDGHYWVRPEKEFNDGRFVPAT